MYIYIYLYAHIEIKNHIIRVVLQCNSHFFVRNFVAQYFSQSTKNFFVFYMCCFLYYFFMLLPSKMYCSIFAYKERKGTQRERETKFLNCNIYMAHGQSRKVYAFYTLELDIIILS